MIVAAQKKQVTSGVLSSWSHDVCYLSVLIGTSVFVLLSFRSRSVPTVLLEELLQTLTKPSDPILES